MTRSKWYWGRGGGGAKRLRVENRGEQGRGKCLGGETSCYHANCIGLFIQTFMVTMAVTQFNLGFHFLIQNH